MTETDTALLNRRTDPRTDRLFSLRNLLRHKAAKFNWPLMVLGNSEDILIAASQECVDSPGALLEASRTGRIKVWRDGHPTHSSLRFRVGDQELVLVAVGPESGHESKFPGMLESVLLGATAMGIERIFSQANCLRPRGDEGPLIHLAI